MGAWSEGGFGNDTALDYADEVVALGDLERALGPSEGLYDADAACEAVAAAEIIAACLGRPGPDLPDNIKEKLGEFGKPSDALIQLSSSAVSEVSAASELAELWEEAEDGNWKEAVNDLLARLDLSKPYTAPPAPEPTEVGEVGSACCLCGEDIAETDEVLLKLEEEHSTMTMYAHRACLQKSFDPPHFNVDNTPTHELLAQIIKTF